MSPTPEEIEAGAVALMDFHDEARHIHGQDIWREQAAAVLEAAASVPPPADGVELLPAERMALTVATAQVKRGDEVPPNTTAMLVLALNRLVPSSKEPTE